MRAKKSLGQNFLMHARIAERIADAAQVGKGDIVLEIGPGTGMLTKPLLARANKVVAVETDAELIPGLKETFAEEIRGGKLELIESDIRAFDPVALGKSYALVANIPYYITGEILRSFLESEHRPSSMTLLVQKEVAERIARSKKESLLSVSVKVFGTPRYEFTVPRGAFKPAPNVDSAVFSVQDIKSPFGGKKDEKRFFDIVRAGFAHRRKLLRRNLEAVAGREAIESALIGLHIPEKARAEDLSVDAWMRLAARLD
jgi:16S rRNA (adenine1518-N6/adenine1519-N6)-dimethyltransferase